MVFWKRKDINITGTRQRGHRQAEGVCDTGNLIARGGDLIRALEIQTWLIKGNQIMLPG